VFRFHSKRARTSASAPVVLNAEIRSYLVCLYAESRQILFRILLGEALPQREPFPMDPARTAETLHKIEVLIANDAHLDGCRKQIGEKFPWRLAELFNLAPKPSQVPANRGALPNAGPQYNLLANDALRQSIRDHVRRHQAMMTGQPPEQEDVEAMNDLKGSSRLQQQLAYLVDYTPNKWLLEQEIPIVLESRARRLHGHTAHSAATAGADAASAGASSVAAFSRGENPYAWSGKVGRLSGLCFSGGGIRSATFNLGVLQGLAKKNLIRRFDYLSSVSGGGYIHQWFAAWVKREEKALHSRTASPGLDAVCRQMIPLPDKGCAPQSAEAIRWLRRFSNYLTPEVGLFSADTWVTFAIWIRNTFLNQLILISFLTSLLLLPHLLLLPAAQLPRIMGQSTASGSGSGFVEAIGGYGPSGLLILFVLLSFGTLVRNLAAGLLNARKGSVCSTRLDNYTLCLSIVVPSLVISIFDSLFAFYFKPFGDNAELQLRVVCIAGFLGLLALALAITIAGGAMSRRPGAKGDSQMTRVVGFTLAAILAAAAGTAVIVMARNTFVNGNPVHFCLHTPCASAPVAAASSTEVDPKWRATLVLGPLVIMMVPFLTIILQCGLIGYDFEDWVLEWLARLRAWVSLYAISWSVLIGISLFGHQLIQFLIDNGSRWLNWTAIGGWVLTTGGSVLAGKSSSTSGDSDGEASPSASSRLMSILTQVGPPAYILGLLLVVSWAAQELLLKVGISNQTMPHATLAKALLVFLVPAVIFVVFGSRVDINEFSMHSYYRNRLARCYLGASNADRDPDPLTGFDTGDVENMQLSTFLPSHGYTGPFPIFGAALNISVGEDLAWQERKAASFAFTPLLSGYHIPWTGGRPSGELSYNGFVPTERFAYRNGGVHISTVTAVSGAAISPNWGYHTSRPMAFLLTMFNVRLGWWMPNPRRSFLAFDPTGHPPHGQIPFPRSKFAPSQLLQELLGRVGDDQQYVYLTDGGHFDNMGLYELVRRRCYEIVICDAEEDDGPVFDGIGMAIRKCRIDFGVEIDLDLSKLAHDAATKASPVHWIAGTIRYPETPEGGEGTILYIKSSVTGDEAADVYNYRLEHPIFPQDSTNDQWFTESQFEGYRRLGQHVVDKCPYL